MDFDMELVCVSDMIVGGNELDAMRMTDSAIFIRENPEYQPLIIMYLAVLAIGGISAYYEENANSVGHKPSESDVSETIQDAIDEAFPMVKAEIEGVLDGSITVFDAELPDQFKGL